MWLIVVFYFEKIDLLSGFYLHWVLDRDYLNICLKFGGLVEVESTYWGVVKLFNMQNKLMDVHQSDISKILPSSISNLVSFIFIKSRHFTEAYLILLVTWYPAELIEVRLILSSRWNEQWKPVKKSDR